MEAVGRLTGGIAHDFNNLLTAIIGNVELANRRNTSTDERVAKSLGAIRQASMRAATLVQRLLTFSRQHPQEVKAVDINRLVGEMSELLHRSIGETVTVAVSSVLQTVAGKMIFAEPRDSTREGSDEHSGYIAGRGGRRKTP